MNPDHCLVEREGHVLTITLNRPEAKNALSGGMLAGMYRGWRLLDEDPDLRPSAATITLHLQPYAFVCPPMLFENYRELIGRLLLVPPLQRINRRVPRPSVQIEVH